MRTFLLIFAALIGAGGSGYYLLQGLGVPDEAAVPAEVVVEAPTEIFVPATRLGVGSIILPEHLARMPVADEALTGEMIVADEAGEALLVGSVARQALAEGLPIARSATVQPGERGFLAAVLPKGKRAISIPISETAGISGLILPGDRVDVILTYSLTADVVGAGRDIRASETVMRNLRVLALDHRLNSAASTGEEGASIDPPIPQTAALEVTPHQAETITLATTLGELSLVLNSVRDGGEAAPEVAEGDATNPLDVIVFRPRDAGGTAPEIQPRHMTLDSDVTSLLRRRSEPVSEPEDLLSRVQVVRGRTSSAVEIGGAPMAAGAAGAAPTALPVVE